MLTIRNHYSLFNFFSLKERDHAESSAICAPKKFSSTSRSNEFGRYTSKSLNQLCNKKFCDIRIAPSLNFEMFNVIMMKSEMLNQLCCLKEIIVLPSPMLFVVLQTPRKFNQDETISRTSTNTLNIEHSYKMKAIFNSKSYCFPLSSQLLGLYGYRLKHLAILEEINTTTTRKFYFSYNDDFNNQDDSFNNQVY